jgi:hypothetical protein
VSGPASSYSQITTETRQAIWRHSGADPTVSAYMICRAALLFIMGVRGRQRAAELAYALADEFATADAPK